jgi:hypothetical protein
MTHKEFIKALAVCKDREARLKVAIASLRESQDFKSRDGGEYFCGFQDGWSSAVLVAITRLEAAFESE